MPPPDHLKLSGQAQEAQRGVEDAWASGWTAVTARDAVDLHKRGTFTYSWQLSIDAPSYPPIRAALNQRIAAARSAAYSVEGPDRAPGRFETEAAEKLVEQIEDLERSTFRDLAMMGFAVWQHETRINPETLRREIVRIERWPLAAVERRSWSPDEPEGYFAITAAGKRIPLPKPGTTDGHWTLVGEGDQPHLDGAITALDTAFVAGQRGRMSYSKATDAAGRASPYAVLPEKMAVDSDEGRATKKAIVAIGMTQIGAVFPHGVEIDKYEMASGTTPLFVPLSEQESKMVALALLGHAGTISQPDGQYTNPQAQAVPEDLARDNVNVFCGAVNAILRMLAAVNVGADAEPPVYVGVLPDSDHDARKKAEDERRKGRAERTKMLLEVIEAERKLGPVDQERIDTLAADFDVLPPKLGEPLRGGAPPAAPPPQAPG